MFFISSKKKRGFEPKVRMERSDIPLSSRFRQKVKKARKGVFYFFEEETRIRAQGSHGAKRHPPILSLPEGMKKRPERVFFISSKKKRGFEPKVRMER